MKQQRFSRMACRRFIAECPKHLRGQQAKDHEGVMLGRYRHPWTREGYDVYSVIDGNRRIDVATVDGRIV